MTFYAFSALVNAVASGYISILTFRSRNSDAPRLPFMFFAISIFLWSCFYYLWQTTHTEILALLWIQLFSVAANFIAYTYFHFACVLSDTEPQHRQIIRAGYVIAIISSIADFSPLSIPGVTQKLVFQFWPNAGILYSSFLLMWISYFIYGFILLKRKYKISSGAIRKQVIFVLLGTLLGFLGGITNYFLWFDIFIPPYGNILVSLYVIFTGYAILKHNLFNTKVVAIEMLVYVLWAVEFFRISLAGDSFTRGWNVGFFLFSISIGLLLIRSVNNEVATELKLEQSAEELRIANKHLEEMAAMKTQLLALATHRLRGSLAEIRGYAAILLDGTYGELSEKLTHVITNISQAGYDMEHMISNFLDASHLAGGSKPVISLIQFDLIALARESIGTVCVPIKEKGLLLKHTLSEPVSYLVHADIESIRRIIGIFADNAVRFTKHGTVSIAVTPEQRENKDGVVQQYARYSITDTGIGVPLEDQSLLFDTFSRASNANDTYVLGNGVNLFIAKRLIEEQGGYIGVVSEGREKGATFWFMLPCIDGAAD